MTRMGSCWKIIILCCLVLCMSKFLNGEQVKIRHRRALDVDAPNQVLKNESMSTDAPAKEPYPSAQIPISSGSTYVRWGRTICSEKSQLVYAGVAGGSKYEHTGGGANYLCLTTKPLWGDYNDALGGHSYVYGAEYETGWPLQSDNIEGDNHSGNDAPCAVCLTTGRVTNVMIPGRNECLGDGWTLEYHGYVMSGHMGHKGRAEFVCMDAAPEADAAGYENKDEALFYYTEAACGSLPCPPYVNGREITCAVCSK